MQASLTRSRSVERLVRFSCISNVMAVATPPLGTSGAVWPSACPVAASVAVSRAMLNVLTFIFDPHDLGDTDGSKRGELDSARHDCERRAGRRERGKRDGSRYDGGC